jgi:four helix bundle protein
MNRFKNLKVWQEAVDLAVDIYKATSNFPKEEKYSLISQMNRAVISVSSNIAEGAGRNSDKEFINFLSIAMGSTYELESQLIISEKLNFISKEQLEFLNSRILLIQNMIFKLQESLRKEKINTNPV